MLKVAVFGANGRMGRAVTRVVSASSDAEIVAACTEPGHETVGQDVGELAGLGSLGIPISGDAEDALVNADVAIDFTLPAAVPGNLAAAQATGCALVMGTTGLSADHVGMLSHASDSISILYGRNLSVGVNVFTELARQAASYLDGDWDVEITEAHHRYKLDAPSGTALQLGEAVADARGQNLADVQVLGRSGHTGERPKGAIGIHAIRAGNIVGDHTVAFVSDTETVELTHHAVDRELFASGALRAAAWLVNKPAGLYSMRDVLGFE
ncbi:MAG: 4-hydroxy-tetrahydrodipicolinate reductase [Gammaproteobacteria bacterium]|nr:4-hydroxy-tetrahydrodipicolinate reductase [Gammaproteobacteria bacterium]NND53521.1 4-hydroxy-tetrahydrodipicolinate reductase [Gammaproteobacteria bacterium]